MTRVQAIKGLILPGALSVLALIVLILLGTWQMQRLAWKENLIATASERANRPARPLHRSDTWPELDLTQHEYRLFHASGRFRHQDEVQVYTVLSDAKGTYSGAGYWILTPFELENGGIVIVNRGFVPLEKKSPSTRGEGQTEGMLRITGLLRQPEQPNYFTPKNDANKNAWYSRSPAEIAQAFNLKDVAPFILDATGEYRPGMLPQPNETKLTFTNNHLGYALTWYGLACTLIGVFAAFAWQRLRAAS